MGKTLLTRQLVVLTCDAQRNAAKGAALLLPIRVPLIDIATLSEKKGETLDEDYDLFEELIEATWGVNSIPVQLYRHAKHGTLPCFELRVPRIGTDSRYYSQDRPPVISGWGSHTTELLYFKVTSSRFLKRFFEVLINMLK